MTHLGGIRGLKPYQNKCAILPLTFSKTANEILQQYETKYYPKCVFKGITKFASFWGWSMNSFNKPKPCQTTAISLSNYLTRKICKTLIFFGTVVKY